MAEDEAQTASVRTWSDGQANEAVILYTISDEGHSWPGSPTTPKAIDSQAVNATDLMWNFSESHQCRRMAAVARQSKESSVEER